MCKQFEASQLGMAPKLKLAASFVLLQQCNPGKACKGHKEDALVAARREKLCKAHPHVCHEKTAVGMKADACRVEGLELLADNHPIWL